MQQIVILLVLMVVGIPLVAIIWIIARTLSTRDQIEELSRRVDCLQLEISQLRQAGPPPGQARDEKSAGFTPAPLPPRKTEMTSVAPTPPLPEAAATASSAFSRAPEIARPVPPPPLWPSSEPNLPPPPIIPPSPIPPLAPMGLSPEPIQQTVKSSAAPLAEPPPLPEKTSFEMRLGTFWLVRIGMVMLMAAFGFFVNYAYHNIVGRLGPGGKISLLYLASGLLLGAGAWWQRRNVKESLKHYAQVLFAGGLAAVYFTTYAAHYAPPVRVIPSMMLDGTLLLAWAGVIAWIADRRKSEVMALFAVGLAFFTSVITRVGEFTLYSNLILTITAVVFLVRNRWAGLSFASLAASYAGYAFWRFLHEDGWRWATPDENLRLGAGFLVGYWLVFTVATFLAKSDKLAGPRRALFLTLNNGVPFVLFLLTMLQVHTGGFWKVSLGYGAVLLGLGALAKKFLPTDPLAKNAYFTQGLLLVTLGFIAKFTGLQLALILGAESVVLYVPGAQLRKPVLKFFAYASAVLATAWCVANMTAFDDRGLWPAVALGGLLAFNACWAHRMDRDHPQPLRAEPSAFTLLAFVAWLAATWFNATASQLPLVLATEAVALTISIYVLRVREITLLGQCFLLFAQLAWLFNLLTLTPPWWNPLAIIVATIGLSYWWQRQKVVAISPNGFAGYSSLFARIYRWLALAMSLLWINDYVPERQHAWVCMLAAAAVLALALRRASREALLAAAIYAAASLARLWWGDDLMMDLYWPNWLSLLALLAMQQLLRRQAARLPLDENTHGAVVFLGGVSLWRFLSCWAAQFGGGVSMTMTWAGFAVAVFAAGIFLRDRFYRWFGLGVLAAAVGRVVLVDVWNQQTIYRVLTFLALGLALLLVGFIYNKYQEKIRRWL